MIVYLVIDDGATSTFKPYAERYRVFQDKELAVEYAKSLGWDSLIGFSGRPGMANLHACGDVNVTILPLEVG